MQIDETKFVYLYNRKLLNTKYFPYKFDITQFSWDSWVLVFDPPIKKKKYEHSQHSVNATFKEEIMLKVEHVKVHRHCDE